MYRTVTVFCPRCGCRTLEMLTTHSSCTECNYSPDTDDHVHLHGRDPVLDDESAYEMDERSRETSDDDEENQPDDDEEEEEEEEEEDAFDLAARKRNEEIRKLKGFVRDGFLDPAELAADYPDHFGSAWYWDEDGIRTNNDPDYVDPDETWDDGHDDRWDGNWWEDDDADVDDPDLADFHDMYPEDSSEDEEELERAA